MPKAPAAKTPAKGAKKAGGAAAEAVVRPKEEIKPKRATHTIKDTVLRRMAQVAGHTRIRAEVPNLMRVGMKRYLMSILSKLKNGADFEGKKTITMEMLQKVLMENRFPLLTAIAAPKSSKSASKKEEAVEAE